ncbi:MAG: ABC transporter permease [Nitrospinae bacterium]|nr:ABC transporter permease [Nitrospinota bacterium]
MVREEALTVEEIAVSEGWGTALLRFGREKPLGAAGAVLMLITILAAIFAPFLAPADPLATNPRAALLGPSSQYLLGSDWLGRDSLSRIIYGARTSIYVGFLATLLGTVAGSLLNVFSAYKGGVVDMVVQRIMDVLLAFPTLIMALAIMAVLGTSINNTVIAIAIPFIPRSGRVVRSAALAVKESQYVEVSRAVGCRPVRLVFRHVIPNCVAPYLIIATALLGTAILVEASLSFLGLGVDPQTPSWGSALAEAMEFWESSPWLAIFPGIAISLAVFGVNLLGDALRDVLDPRLKQL